MHIHPKRALAVAAALITGFGALVTGGTAQAAVASNYAHSSANAWNKNSFDVAFQVRQLFSHSVNAYNQADASSKHCGGCRSVAIAFQIVADARTPEYIDAGNHASAVNEDCGGCQTLGVAYQFVMGKPTVLDWGDLAKLYRIDYQLEMLRWSHAPTDSVAGQVDALAGQVAAILANAGSGHGCWPLVHRYLTWHH
jgi:hypothetical protein